MLSVTSEYALRALAELARKPRHHAILGRDLAESTGVPPKYLSKIMLSLRNAGIVSTSRGTGGGYRLHRRPESIRMMEIVRLFEGPAIKPSCLLHSTRKCSEQNPCTAHPLWRVVQDAYLQFLHGTTLNDLADNRSAPAADSVVPVGGWNR